MLSLLLPSLSACSGGEESGGGRPSLGILRVIDAEGRFVAGEAGGAVLLSSDGMNWTVTQTAPRQPLAALAWDGSRLLALGYGLVENDVLLESVDGRDWQARPLDHYEEFTDMLWSGRRFVAVGEGGAVLLSENGTDWRFVDNGVTSDTYLTGLSLQGGRLIAVGWGGWLLNSFDEGDSWSGQQLDGFPNLQGIAWSGDRYVVVGENGVIFSSEDGDNWQGRESGTRQHLLDVAWGEDRFVAVGFEGTVIESPDGVEWHPLASGTQQILTSVAWGNGRFAVVGRNSTVIGFSGGGSPAAGRIDYGDL